MPLHSRSGVSEAVRQEAFDEVRTFRGRKGSVPRYRISAHPHRPEEAYAIVKRQLSEARCLNLATFCQTWLEPQVHKLMDQAMDPSGVDKDEYPETAEIENRCVQMLAGLWHAPRDASTVGCSTAGSSEAAMLGGLAMKWRWRKRQQQLGRPQDRPNVVCGPVQICWHRFARYFDVELRQVPLAPGRLVMTPDQVIERCDENTIGVVPTLGVTSTLQYEPVEAIARALDTLERTRGLDIPIHVDAASGGFLAPFVQPGLVWDFRLPRVKSINTSGHKFGLTPLGCGWAVWREEADLPEELVFRMDHLGGEVSTFALNFSRPVGAVVVQYYNFLRLGWEGYRKIHLGCAETAAYLAVELSRMGPFEVLSNGHGGVPGVVWTLRQGGHRPHFSLFELADCLRTRGWQVPAYTLPARLQDTVVQRALIRHGISRGLAQRLVTAIAESVRELEGKAITSAKTLKRGTRGYQH